MNRGRKRILARLPAAIGMIAVLLLVGFLGVWGTQSQISGAILARGQVHIETKRQAIQHASGGIVGAILVTEGQVVAKGDVLIRLDSADIKTEIDILLADIADQTARVARFRAERDGAPTMAPMTSGATPVEVAAYETQVGLFRSRQANHRNEIDQLAEVATQTARQVTGIAAQLDAVDQQAGIISQDVARQEELVSRDLGRLKDLSAVRAQAIDLRGQAGSLQAEIGRLNSRIAQIRIERLRIDAARQENAIANLAEISASLGQNKSLLAALQRQLADLNISSPVDGTVLEIKVGSIQSVVRGGVDLLYIVPHDQNHIVRARVSENDIDQIRLSQNVTLRFSALDTRFSPNIHGVVEGISADILVDKATGAQFYEARIRPDRSEIDALGQQKIIPGMPVEVYIKTGDRSPLAYLVKPMADYFYRAFRHD